MPIEIRELIIEARVLREDDREEGSTQILTDKDMEEMKSDIIETVNAEGVILATEQRRQLMDDILREVNKLMEDRWRR